MSRENGIITKNGLNPKISRFLLWLGGDGSKKKPISKTKQKEYIEALERDLLVGFDEISDEEKANRAVMLEEYQNALENGYDPETVEKNISLQRKVALAAILAAAASWGIAYGTNQLGSGTKKRKRTSK